MKRVVLAIGIVAACGPPPAHQLPGVTNMPQPSHPSSPPACEQDTSLNGDGAIDVRYTFSYDSLGRLSHADGVYASGAPDETVDYRYDNIGHMVDFEDVQGGSNALSIVSNYDTLGDLLDYTYAPAGMPQHYVMSALTPTGQPTVQVISVPGQPDMTFLLSYDADNRMVVAAQQGSGGTTTTYTYDDGGRTVIIDGDNGAFTGQIDYDDQNRELSEQWGGSNPYAQHSATTYKYDGDRLATVTYQQGVPLVTVEVDTFRYTGCSR